MPLKTFKAQTCAYFYSECFQEVSRDFTFNMRLINPKDRLCSFSRPAKKYHMLDSISNRTHHLLLLKAAILRSGCQQCWLLLRMWGRIPHAALLTGWPSLVFLGLYIHIITVWHHADIMLTSCLHGSLPVCPSMPQFPLSQEHRLYWVGAYYIFHYVIS